MAKTKKKVQDITGLGWDFDYPDRNESITPATFGITSNANLSNLQNKVMPTSLMGAQQQMGMSGQMINGATAAAPAAMAGATSMFGGNTSQLPASTWMTPQEQQPVKDYLADPKQVNVPTPVDAAKTWLSNLFDTSDTFNEEESGAFLGYKGGTGPVETVWDSMLTGLGWGYDRLNHLTTAAISAAPGGIRTLTWDEASNVSVGQAFVGSMAAGAGRVKRGEMQVGDFLSLPGTLASSALSMIDPNNPAEQANFDITNEAQREAAFSNNTAGKLASGTLDTAFTIFGDPLLLGGKATKIARLTMLDRPITEASRAKITNELQVGRVTVTGGDPAQINRLAPPAQFANWVTQKNDLGEKVITREEIFNHRVIKYATNRDGLASALYNAENYDEAALVLRSAIGDLTAQTELMALRADLAIEIGDAQRRLTMAKFAMNPETKAQMVSNAEKVTERANQRLLDVVNKYGGIRQAENTDEYMLAKAKLDQANETWIYTDSLDEAMVDPLNPLNFTADSADVARRAVKQMTDRDRYFMKSYADESTRVNFVSGSLMKSTAGFSRNNRFGRVAEKSRERRATAAYQTAATRGARVVDKATGQLRGGNRLTAGARLHFWESDVFGNNGLTRTLRLWRWMSEETPSGFVTTRGIGAQESTREIRASLNDVPIFSGNGKTVTLREQKKNAETGEVEEVTREITVGGIERKEQLIGMYMDALQDTTYGDMAAKHALDILERQIANDIGVWYGLDADTIKGVTQTAQVKRNQTVDSIKNEGYWVDENKNINRSPWLETQLQQGTYMLNWKAFENRARLYDETGWVKRADVASQATAFHTKNAYEFFNEVWRPAVLMRLGYTQRNVTEGLMRATAFQFSLAPVKYATWQGAFAVRNAWVRHVSTRQGAIEDAVKAIRVADQTGQPVKFPKKFVRWRVEQIAATDQKIGENVIAFAEIAKQIAPLSDDAKEMALSFVMKQANDAADEAVALRNSNASPEAINLAEEKLKAMNEYIGEYRKIVPSGAGSAAKEVEIAMGHLKFFSQMDDYYRSQRSILDGDLESVALFQQQANAKRRVFDGSFSGPDQNTYMQAFSEDSPYTPVALMNLSSDNTQKAMASLYMDAMNNALVAVSRRYYVAVEPKQGDAYFEGVATAIRQFRNSEVGDMVVNGAEPDDIINFLLKDPEGRQIGAFIKQSAIKQENVNSLPAPIDYDSAAEYVSGLFARWQQLAPSPELRDYVKNVPNMATDIRGGGGWNGDVVKTFLDVKDPSGNPIYQLKPVIGNIAEETGFSTIRQQWARIANTGMKWLGTIPEDAFVRAPFYGRQYEETMKALIKTVQAQTPGNFIPVSEIEKLQRIAHRRALKNTKDWLYTIDRRTRLGATGEYMFPFISAAQNSVTTMGRLIWNDPSLVAIAALVWNAPNRMEITDENGDIVIPIPHAFIPDGIEEALGLDNMMNWKIDKGALNVFLPETGFGVLPRPGPQVVVPINEFMKRGWFGQSVESPEVLRGVFGKEKADQFWNVWKDYVFGEEGGMTPDSLSLFAPPAYAKILQMFQGEGSSRQYAYYYNLQLRTELAQYAGGYRDTYPSKEEIASKTDGFYMMRIMANLLAFTPPQYESDLDPLVNAIRAYDKEYGRDGARMANEAFGNMLFMLGDWSNSKNVAGMMPYTNSIEAARKYGDIISAVAPGLSESGNLSVLSMLVNDDPNAFYDGSAYAWQFSNKIPGVTDYFREMQTPEQSLFESQKNAGWTEFISRMDYLDALLQQRGLTSYRSAGATDLREMKNQTIARLRDNPLYAGWYQDYEQFGSTRTQGAVRLMEQALSNQEFVDDHADSRVWQAAYQYLQFRNMVMDTLATRTGGINNSANEDIRVFWDAQRQELINKYEGWGTFSNRFLNGDEDPENLGVQFGVVYDLDNREDANGYPAG